MIYKFDDEGRLVDFFTGRPVSPISSEPHLNTDDDSIAFGDVDWGKCYRFLSGMSHGGVSQVGVSAVGRTLRLGDFRISIVGRDEQGILVAEATQPLLTTQDFPSIEALLRHLADIENNQE